MFRNINLLITFECAARYKSYSLAASELCISQAAVSQQMRLLEQTLNTKLFIRKSRQMLLTQQGLALFETSKEALTIINQGINQIHREELIGELTISSTQAFTSLWLMPRLQNFSKIHPDIQINVVSSSGFEDLKQAHIDLAIRFGLKVEQRTHSDLECEYFGESHVYPICSKQLWQQASFQTPEELLNTWLVSLENPGPYDWHSWFSHQNIEGIAKHKQWTKVASTDMALNAVINGHGATLAVPYLCQHQLESGELMMPFKLPHPNPVKRYLVYDKHSARIERLKVFMAWLKSEMSLSTSSV